VSTRRSTHGLGLGSQWRRSAKVNAVRQDGAAEVTKTIRQDNPMHHDLTAAQPESSDEVQR
jgi:hypothetical protein